MQACLGVALLSLAADAATKAWARSALRGGHQVTVAGGLVRLRLVANHGAAFGLGAGYEPLIVVVSIAGVILLGSWAWYASSAVERFGAALAAGGAAGNLTDRLTHPLRDTARCRHRLDPPVVLRPDLQPGRRLAPSRRPDRRRCLAAAPPDRTEFIISRVVLSRPSASSPCGSMEHRAAYRGLDQIP